MRRLGARKTRLESLKRPDDVVLRPSEPEEPATAILILGPTGVGKSTFIRNVLSGVDATHSQMPDIGEGSTACTQKITHYVVDLPSRGVAGTRAGGRRLILVDTPGLDSHGTPEHSFELLRSITVWLASLHHDKLKLGAIIYMYPIYPGRITRNELAIFRVFKKICGTQNLARVITITTKWDICPPKMGDDREAELWHAFLGQLANKRGRGVVMRLEDTRESALNVLNEIARHCVEFESEPVVYAIQREIVEEGSLLSNTAAAKALVAALAQKSSASSFGDPLARMVAYFRHPPGVSSDIMSQVKMYPDNDPNVPTDYKAVPESRHCDTCICPMPQNPDIMDPNIIRDLQSHIPSFELAASHLRAEAPYRVRSPSDLMDPPSRTGTLYFTAPSTPADEVFTGPLLHPISSSAATLPLPGNAPYDRTCSPNTSSHHPYASRPHHNLNPYAASSSTVVATSDLLHPHASHNRHASSSTTLAPASSTNMFAGAHNFHIQSQSNTVCTGNYTTIIQSPLCGNCGAIR